MSSLYACRDDDCQLLVPENGQIVKGCSSGKDCELVQPEDIGMAVINEEVGPGVVLKDFTCMLNTDARSLIDCAGSGCVLTCATSAEKSGHAVVTYTSILVGSSLEDCRKTCCGLEWCKAFDVDDSGTCRFADSSETAETDGYTTFVVR